MLPLEGAIHHFLDLLHTRLVLALLEDGLDLFGLEVVIGELLGYEIDVLDCLAWIEEKEPVSTVVWEKFLVCLYEKFEFDLKMVVQHQWRVVQPTHLQRKYL